MRQKTVSRNLANLNTPGFTRSDVDFFSHMRQLFDGDDVTPTAAEDTVTPVRLDGNNVTVEREMFALSETEILYNAASRFASGALARMKYAIGEGRG
jgi:flagellar basal-body rod protein FlgB